MKPHDIQRRHTGIVRKSGLVLIALLALTTAISVAFAVREHRLAEEQRASAEKAAAEQRQEWEKRLADLQRQLRALETELASARDRATGEQLAATLANGETPPTRGGPRGGRRNGEGGPAANFMAMMEDPNFAQLWSAQQRAQLDGRYADLFKNLKLSPAELEKFKNLLVEKQTSFRDVTAAARAQGIDPRENRDQMRQLIQQANQEIDSNIQSVLGADGFAQYKQFEETAPQRNVVSQLDRRLSYTSTPLNQSQSDQLVQILAQNTAPSSNGNQGGGFRGAAGLGEGRVQVTDQAIAQASSVLTPAQVSALQQLQSEQQAQQQLWQAMRQQRNAAPGTSTTPITRTTPGTPKSPSGG